MNAAKGARPGGSGLTDGESAIMDLWDAGLRDYDELGERTGYRRDYVKSVVGRYAVSEQSLSAFDRMSKAGTASLLAAIRCFHPEVFSRGHQ